MSSEAKASSEKDVPIEKALARLEEIVAKLESGDVDLERSIELYAEGRRLGKRCQDKLGSLERRIKLVREGADGQPVLEDFQAAE